MLKESPPLPPPNLPPKDISSSSRNVPPVVRDSRRSPFHLSSWSGSSSRRHAPPNISITQDSAFPPFPTSKSRSVTPTTPSSTNQSFAIPSGEHQAESKSESSFAPLSPRDNGGGSFLQRMNTIAPGPFHSNGQTELRPSGHKRTATMGSSKDFTHQPIVGIGKGDFQRPSTAGSTKSNAPSLSSISGGPRSTVKREGSQVPDIPSAPQLLRSQTVNTMSSQPMLSQQTDTIDILRQENRSNTFPLDKSEDQKREELGAVPVRKLSEPSNHVTKPSISVASAIRPLHEIGSISSFKSSRSIKSRPQSPVVADTSKGSRSTSRNEVRNDGPRTPVVSVSTQLPQYEVGNPYHTPTESIASNDSSGSDARSGSSTSTPPLFDSPQKQTLADTSRNHDEPDSWTSESPTILGGIRRVIPPSFSRPTYARPADKPALEQGIPPRLMIDPAIQSGRHFPEESPTKAFNPASPLPCANLPLPASLPPKAPSSARSPKTASKGKCRGCQEAIRGKSVSSADGRLTGRYHKECFVCTTCKEPFRTADFYILDNQPYCEKHYHILNQSLCKSCDRGIEGQYLETESKQKFHRNCFTCQVSYELS